MWSEDHWECNRKMQSHSAVWVAALILALLVALTVAVVGTYFYTYAYQSDCKISLYDGLVEETAGVMQRLSGRNNENSVIESRTVLHGTKLAKGQPQGSSFVWKDSSQIWETETTVELFQTEYKNEEGKITVKSADEDAVIAPGTEGQYTFRLENTYNAPADCVVWVDAELSSNITAIPLQMRVGSDRGWLLGDDEHWVGAAELSSLVAEETMDVGKSIEYTIYWQWPFEQENDAADTALGDAAMGQGLSYTVTIHTLATTTEDIPSGGDTSPEGDTFPGDDTRPDGDTDQKEPSQKPSVGAGKTGDDSSILFAGVVFGVSAGILLFIFVLRKRKNDREKEQNQ